MGAPPFDTPCKVEKAEGSISDDLMLGHVPLAKFLDVPPRTALRMLERGLVPAGRLGGKYITSRRRVREHLYELAAGGTVR